MQLDSSRVIFKSTPLTGIMAERYFELATPEHFWCKRRFEVLKAIAGDRLRSAVRVAEIGCGNGVVQKQLEDAFDLSPAGFDLHEAALRRNMCQRWKVYCYDIHDRAEEFRKAFDVLLMFDVLEHIEDQERFLDSARFHLADGGCIIINVPALQWLFSPYDQIQGHQRRYSVESLSDVAHKTGFETSKITYWGLTLVPILALRKLALTIGKAKLDNYEAGFDSRGNFVNTSLYHLSRCEMVPQSIAGTSVMAVLDSKL